MGEATDAARHARDAVYALFGKEDPPVFDFGLSTPTEHRSKGDAKKAEENATPRGGDAPKG